jgi:hypothetical protein
VDRGAALRDPAAVRNVQQGFSLLSSGMRAPHSGEGAGRQRSGERGALTRRYASERGPEVTPAYEATLGELFELRRTHSKGYGYNRLFRSGGRLGRYLVIQGYTDLAAAGSANMPPRCRSSPAAVPPVSIPTRRSSPRPSP